MIASALALFLTSAQVNALNLSMQEGSKYGYPYTVAALIWQESSFCARINHPDRSHGCGGIRIQTAEFTEGRHVSVDEINNSASNMAIAAHYFAICIAQSHSWRRAVAEYHYGIPIGSRMSQEEIDKDPYVLSVAAKVKQLMSMRQDHE